MQALRYTAFVNAKDRHDVTLQNNDIQLDGKTMDWDCVPLGHNRFHILSNGRSYDAYVVNVNRDEKIIDVLINNRTYSVKLKDRYDALLEQLGMNDAASGKLSDLKSPMPGLVLKIMVADGDVVKKGDSLIVLEAMKMENMLKAQGSGTVKSVKVQPGNVVEKGALLIQFG